MPEISKSSKLYLNGVEFTPNLTFTGWQAGFEYSKNIKLKNMNTKTVKLTYQVPKTKFFTTLFSKPLSLSPGTTFTLPITFRPLDKINYEDYIEIYQVDFQKSFKIPLIAQLPQFKINFANELHLGACASNEKISKKILIQNLSELDTLFEWDCKNPFKITPNSGEIKAFSSIEVDVIFHPAGALVYKGTAICKYGHNPLDQSNFHKAIELYGTGKYPHLLVADENNNISSEASLDFGKVQMGETKTKYFTIINMTEVATNFFIEKCSDVPSFDACFNCLQLIGFLQPYEKQTIPISYSPNTPCDDTVYDYFNVFSSGKLTKNLIRCVANNNAPKVEIDKEMLSFGLCYVGEKVAQTFKLINSSSSSLSFQFVIDSETSTFKLSLNNGILKPNESKLIQVYFSPQYPIIYYKKVACLIQNHDVLFIEMIGTSHLDLMRPPVISKKHIELYYYLKKQQLLNNTPEQLMELYSSGKLKIDENKINKDYLENNLRTKEDTKLLTDEYISDNEHFSKADKEQISIDLKYIDFGASKVDENDEQINEQKSITVTNKTKGKIMLFWNESDQPFKIVPNSCEIPPMKNYSFRIKFSPKTADQFYSTKLECYAIYKSLCDYTLAEPKFLIPSWSFNIDCLGHTFHPSNDTFFLPRYTVDSENIIFPVTIKEKSVFRTLVIKNTNSDCPITYDLKNLKNNEWFVKPHRGLIKKNEHQIFLFKFSPKADTYLVEKCEIMLNYLKKHLFEIVLVGVGLTPQVSLENNGVLYFSPTCKSNFAYQTHEIVNLTRCELRYEWKIPYESKGIFAVDEIESSLQPYEKKKCVWKFSPDKIDKFNHKMTLVTWIAGEKSTKKNFNLRILGCCTNGSLSAFEMYKDFGSVIVGSSISSEIVLINNNDCQLDFELFVKQTTDESLSTKFINDLCVLEFEQNNGHIEARSRQTIRCRLRPTRLISYQFTIEYRIIYPNEIPAKTYMISNDFEKNQKEILCYMTATGVFPKLKINDIKMLGCAANLSKDYFWKLLSIDQLNSTMSCEPNPDELIYSIATRQDVNRRSGNQISKPMIEINFNAAPLNSHDTQIIFFIENSGLVGTEWALLFPKDLLLELEYWAHTGDYDLEELEEMKIQDNKLFTIEPKKGFLEPGETAQIQMTYKHLFAGVNKLPILMKVAKGREIMLNLVGTTTANGEAAVFFPSGLFEFEPMELGLFEYPIQIYEIYNGSDVPVVVHIDDSSLTELNDENYSHNILECMSPKRIVIQPGTIYETKWKFSPIESKTYQVDITFKVNHVHFNVITFKCIGFDKKNFKNIIVSSKTSDVPEVQKNLLPNQPASLSLERINLGEIPLFSRERKLVFVKNNSSQNVVTFTWHVTNPDHINYIRIQPSRGTIPINQSKLCKITFISKEKPSFYNIDLICEIKNETDMQNYRKNVQLWQHEQKRQFEEFIIDENELENRLKDSNKTPDLKANKPNEKQRVSQLSIHRFKTIPPIIKNNVIEESNVERTRRLREEKKVWKKPQPPAPFLLHLNILARTQFIEEFLSNSNKLKNECEKFVDPMLGNSFDMQLSLQDEELNKKIDCNQDENDTITFILSDILRNLVTDKSFQVMVQKLKYDPVPYFIQFTENNHFEQSDENLSSKKTFKSQDKIQQIKSSPYFGSLVETIFENTISNILTEAFNKEFSLTSRPRLIALPPKLNNTYANSSNFLLTSSKKSKNNDLNSAESPTLSIKSIDI